MLNFKSFLVSRLSETTLYEEALGVLYQHWLHNNLNEDLVPNPFLILTPSAVDKKADSAKKANPTIPLGKLGVKIKAELSKLQGETPKEIQKALKIAKQIKAQAITGKETSNPKLEKSGKIGEKLGRGLYTIGLSLAPADMSGINVCPCSTANCVASCLGKEAGRGVMTPVRKGRIDRVKVLMDYPEIFIRLLVNEIKSGLRKAQKEDKQLVVRLNVLSDIAWEFVAPELFTMFPDVQFYDYTKVVGRVSKGKTPPPNYHLTVSSTGFGPDSNWSACKAYLAKGGVVSMVLRMADPKTPFQYPSYLIDIDGKKYKMINGDEYDARFVDKEIALGVDNKDSDEGLIAGLKLKGGAEKQKIRAGSFAVIVEPKKDSNGNYYVDVSKQKDLVDL